MNQHAQTLVTILEARQRELGLTDAAFADRLGVSRQLWAMTRAGQRAVGLLLLQGVVRAFPDLHNQVLAHLQGDT